MAQLFNVYIKSNSHTKMINTKSKLSEIGIHQNQILSEIYNNPSYVSVIGEYEDEKDKPEEVLDVINSEFNPNQKLIICLEKGEYIDTKLEPWFPLALLCAVGNGKGDGDYFGPKCNQRLIGSWVGYHIMCKDLNDFDLKGFKKIEREW